MKRRQALFFGQFNGKRNHVSETEKQFLAGICGCGEQMSDR